MNQLRARKMVSLKKTFKRDLEKRSVVPLSSRGAIQYIVDIVSVPESLPEPTKSCSKLFQTALISTEVVPELVPNLHHKSLMYIELPPSPSPYQLSVSFAHKFLSRYQYDIYEQSWHMVKRLLIDGASQLGGEKRGEGTELVIGQVRCIQKSNLNSRF